MFISMVGRLNIYITRKLATMRIQDTNVIRSNLTVTFMVLIRSCMCHDPCRISFCTKDYDFNKDFQ